MQINSRRKHDLWLIAALLVLSIAAFLIWRFTRTQGEYAAVYQNDTQIARYPLSQDVTIPITDAQGNQNLLRIENGEAHMAQANCPDGLCIQQDAISKNGETIVCLPHKLVIEIVSDKQSEVDIGT